MILHAAVGDRETAEVHRFVRCPIISARCLSSHADAPVLTFFRVFRATWVSLNVLILALTIFGPRDLSGFSLMWSFPADIVSLFVVAALIEGPGAPAWTFAPAFGIAAIAAGYLQWFVVGRALARRVLSWLSFCPLARTVLRVIAVLVFVAQGAVGFEMTRAQGQEQLFIGRAATVREGMTLDQVHAILGKPRGVQQGPDAMDPSSCFQGGSTEKRFYWYEHHSLPRRFWKSSFVLVVCSDAERRVVGRSTIHVD